MKKTVLLLLAPLVLATSRSNSDDFKYCYYLEAGGVDYSSSSAIRKVVGRYEVNEKDIIPSGMSHYYNLYCSFIDEVDSVNKTTYRLPSSVTMRITIPSEEDRYCTLRLDDNTKTIYLTTQESYYSSSNRTIKMKIYQDKFESGREAYNEAYYVSSENPILLVEGVSDDYFLNYQIKNPLTKIKTQEAERYIDLGDSTPVIYSYKK